MQNRNEMGKSDFVTAMFEEIKEAMAVINKKLELEKSVDKEQKKVIPRQFLEFVHESINQLCGNLGNLIRIRKDWS